MICLLFIILNSPWILEAMPLAKRMVDMTHVFDQTTLNFPTIRRFQIDNLHNGTIETLGSWIQTEEYTSGIHVGTHMDSPSDFIKGGAAIDEYPISQFIGPAAVIDITAKAEANPDAEATLEDLLQWESSTGQSLNDTIILLRSGWGHKWHNSTAFFGTSENDLYKLHFPGFSVEACQWLVDNRNIKGIGTEALSPDVGPSRGFPVHLIILGQRIFILENVANMDQLPIYGAKLYVFPMKIGKASGAPVRIVAAIPKVIYNLSSS